MKEEIINKFLEELKNNIPEDYVRSCDTSDGVGYYELDEDSWQYQVYHYIENLQSQLKAKEELIKEAYVYNQMVNDSDYVYSQDEITYKNLEILSKGENNG